MRHLFFIVFSLLAFSIFVGGVLANPIPWDPLDSFLHLEPVQYFSIVTAEFCALVVGTAILTHAQQLTWRKPALTMLVALTVSYLLGVVIWITAFQSGILPFNTTNPASLAVFVLPEIIGILIGTVIIEKLQKIEWKAALITMTAAMVTSLVISVLLGVVHLTLQLS